MNFLGPQPVSGDADYQVVVVGLDGAAGNFASNADIQAKVFATTGPRNSALFEPTVAWTTSSSGQATVSLLASAMAGVPSGQYILEVIASDQSGRSVAGYQAILTLSDGALPDGFAPVTPPTDGSAGSGLTVLALEEELTTQMQGWLEEVFGPVATMVTGKNPYLRWPMREALLYLGVLPTNPLLIADADVAQVPGASVTRYLNLCRCFLVEELYANYTKTDKLDALLSVYYDKVGQRMYQYLLLMRKRAGLMGSSYAVSEMTVGPAGRPRPFINPGPRGLPYRWSSLDCPGVYPGYALPYSFVGYF